MNSYSDSQQKDGFLPTDAMRILRRMVVAPVLGLLLLLEPIVRVLCGLGLALGLFTCLVFKLSSGAPHFPLALMLAISLGFGGLYFVYYWVIALLMGRSSAT